ncbi:MAG: GAF domain-containing protein [Anaerolineales bacterium]|jgi:NtrC-family two-component system sensor histidine kinase KinB
MPEEDKENESTRASLELLYHVSRELATALDLRTVLQRVLILSMRNIGAISGSLIALDDSGQPIESAIIYGSQVFERTTQQLRATLEHGLAGWVTRQHQAVLVQDTSQDKRWLRRPDDAPDRTGPKSALSVPLMVRDRLIGVMTLVHPQPGSFSLDHLALVQAIADQASIAVFNARLYAESQRQARVMTAVAESAAFITASLHLDEVLQRILEQISQALGTEVVSLALIDPKEEFLEFKASTGRIGQSVVGMRLKIGQGIAGWVAKEGRGAVVPDVSEDPRFYPQFDKLTGFDTRAIACAPIRSRGSIIGVLEALNPVEGIFDPEALLVLTGIGSLAGTAIRHAQLFEQLQAAHQRYRELFEDSIDPILITDWQGRIIEANRQAEITTHYAKDALRDMLAGELHAIDMQALGADFEKLTGGETISYESTLKTRSGREVPVQVHAREVDWTVDLAPAQGSFARERPHVQWILRDMTERKNLETLRNDLISMIYHDLRSPLANVVSSLDVLASLSSLEEDPAFKSLLEIAMRSTERIQRLTNSLLDLNRLEAGQPVGDLKPTDPLTLVSEAVEAVMPIARNKEQSVDLTLPEQAPLVSADGDMIRRVLSNLLENAVKFAPAGGTISVGAREEGDSVLMWVKDDGPGIPGSEHERIFDKYTRLQAKDGPKGIGLGLAYCRLAVEAHKGRIWVESEPGEGSIFCFTLPKAGPLPKAGEEVNSEQ